MVRRALAGPKKGAGREGRTVVWADESAFYLLPGAVRTYAPRGRTPILRLPPTAITCRSSAASPRRGDC